MGSDAGPANSQPAHRVYLSAYEIERYEVSNAAFSAYVEETQRIPLVWQDGMPALRANYPVTGITWREAEAYCRWYMRRLPTEAEWEKAARGTGGWLYPWGNEWHPGRANTLESGHGSPVAVNAYPTGQAPYGIYNMIGNVAEWVADYFDPDYYQSSPIHNPQGPEQVLDHGLRGGSWDTPREQATVFFRDSSHSVRPNPRVGFRCAADEEAP